MRPFIPGTTTKVLIAAFLLIVSLTGFAQARDRSSDGHFIRRSHHERQVGERTERFFDGAHDRHHRYDRRHTRKILSNRNVDRRHLERRFDRDRRIGRRDAVREYRRNNRGHWSQGYDNGDFPSRTDAGTYFGGLSAWQESGNGTYFQSERYDDGYGYADRDRNDRRPRPKIIRVTPSSAGRACSWESGVCVIRR